MLGKSVGSRMLGLVIVHCLVLSCARNVPQDKASGEDGKTKGAKTLELENGEAKDTGIVTYPGGDRVDWKVIDIPAKTKGTLDIKLTWTPPRPGLQLGFDVYDEWGTPLMPKKRERKKKRGRVRTAQVEVKGKGPSPGEGQYFIRVYAQDRGDAGKYKLTVTFNEELTGPGFKPEDIEIPDPPKLAAVPEAEVPCDEFTFDKNNPACRDVCPASGAPPGWKACANVCPTPVDPENPACWKSAPCPKPPDRRFRRCKITDFPKCPDINNPDPDNPRCDNAKADPVKGRVIQNSVQGGETIITISAGSDKGVAKGWRGQVLRGDTDTPMVGGDVIVIRVDKTRTTGKTKLTVDQISANPYVKLSPP